jgi:succinate-acetate transporter protein
MATFHPVPSPLGILLLLAAIYLIIKSPKRLQTLGRMALVFVVTVALFILTGLVLRIGDPEAWGRIAGLLGLLTAVIAGWWHTRSMKRASAEVSRQPRSKG